MKILVSPDTGILAASSENAAKWKVNKIIAWGSDIKEDLCNLPLSYPDITFFVPAILDSSNPLSYDGVTLALRILMKYLYETGRGINIVLLGIESKEAFLLHYNYPNILKVPGIHYCSFNQKYVATFPEMDTTALSQRIYRRPLENLGIKMPSSFKSTHSLTNEWCLYKWGLFMGLPIVSKLESLNYLYFDYLKVIEKLNNVKNKELKNNPALCESIAALKEKKARILLIDDNSQWHDFFHEFFKGSKIQFLSIGSDFNKLGIKDVVNHIKEKVEIFSPDVILLDFRLIEDIDADSNFNRISGVEVLKCLKGKFEAPGSSFGRQILMFTATSRIENILRLKQLNADGFILKEKPEQYASKEITKNLISGMVRDITEAIARAEFLIPLNQKLTDITGLLSNPKFKVTANQKEGIETVTESVRLITQNNELKESILKLVYLNLFSILESLKDNTEDINPYIKKQASRLGLDPDTFILWDTLCELRNALAHDGIITKGRLKGRNISIGLLIEWILNLIHFIDKYLVLSSS